MVLLFNALPVSLVNSFILLTVNQSRVLKLAIGKCLIRSNLKRSSGNSICFSSTFYCPTCFVVYEDFNVFH